jgi:hemoglobin
VTVRTWYKQGQRHAYNRRMAVLHEVPEPSLYRRLGGYDAIAAIVDEIFALLRADPRFSRFGAGRSIDSHKRSRQLLVDQICSLSGGPCYYIGRDMKTSHAGLGITESEWTANLELTKQVLESKGVGSREQAEFLALFERYKNDIVECSQSPALSLK